jgi:hypothetical protein
MLTIEISNLLTNSRAGHHPAFVGNPGALRHVISDLDRPSPIAQIGV